MTIPWVQMTVAQRCDDDCDSAEPYTALEALCLKSEKRYIVSLFDTFQRQKGVCPLSPRAEMKLSWKEEDWYVIVCSRYMIRRSKLSPGGGKNTVSKSMFKTESSPYLTLDAGSSLRHPTISSAISKLCSGHWSIRYHHATLVSAESISER